MLTAAPNEGSDVNEETQIVDWTKRASERHLRDGKERNWN